MTNENNRDISLIGVFDSGLGGLSVVRALKEAFPTISFVYFGDTARFPYGTKSSDTICRYSIENTSFLLSKGAQAIVIGCNTASSVALDSLQKKFPVPIFGVIEPAAKRAASMTKNGRIGVIGTARTIKSQSYAHAIERFLPKGEVFSQAAPLLVSLIEDGSPSKHIAQEIVHEYLRPLKQMNIDTLVLGCTHYSLLSNLIQEEIGENVTIIDPAESVAEAILEGLCSSFSHQKKPDFQFFASDDPARFKKVGEQFLGMRIGPVGIGGLHDSL